MRDAALEVERQTLIRQTKRRSYDGLSSGSPSQGSSKRGSFSSGSSGSRGSSGDRRGASGSRFQRGRHCKKREIPISGKGKNRNFGYKIVISVKNSKFILWILDDETDFTVGIIS